MENNQEKPKRTRKKEVLEPTIEEVSNHSLSTEEVIQNEIRKYSVADTVIFEHKEMFKKLKINGIDDKKGYEAVKKAQLTMRDFRTSVENKRTELKADVIKIGKGIDDEAKRLTALIKEVEDPLKEKRQKIDDAKKAEEERIEREAEEKFKNRIAELEAVGISFDGSFYSIGESISVDVFTVKEFTDEVFEEFKKKVSAENEKIQLEKHIQEIHNERREKALPFLAYWDEFEKTLNFGTVSESDFNNFMERIQKAESDFKEKVQKQEDEAKQQIADRKALNYEKRSFKLEKAGFEIYEDGTVFFANEAGRTSISKDKLEDVSNEEFEKGFEALVNAKNELEKQFNSIAENRNKQAEAEAEKKKLQKLKESRTNSMLSIGFEKDEFGFQFQDHFVGSNHVFDSNDEEFTKDLIKWSKEVEEKKAEIENAIEAERLEKLPEIEKATLWIDTFVNAEIPPLKTVEINEIISEFKNKVKLAYNEALSNLKKLS